MFSLQSLLSLAGMIPEVIIFFACLMYLSKVKSSDAKLLFAGSLTGIVVRIFYVIIPYITIFGGDSADYQSLEKYYIFAGIISLIGSLFFCVGLVLLIQKIMAAYKPQN